ncbi:FIG01202709: hypothetical protein [hydrothermal vent metagenome]|uniref:Uncharacterized protein n=1 Tax=hydrothermal vent metagenome TaxID=652676 RepID=A0A3B1BGB3_9ZZZZ
MSLIKKTAVIIIGIIILVVVAGIIKFNFTDDDIYIQNKDGTVEKYDDAKHGSDAYQSKVMLKLFNMKTPNDLIIHIPESKMICKLDDFIMIDSTEMVKGSYTDGVERGIVVLDYMKITTLNISKSPDQNYFVVPFFVSNQGTGVFYYLGLFVRNNSKMTIDHIDSYFLGDRIKISSINSDGNKIQIRLMDHSMKQSMAEEPNEEKNIKIRVTEKGFSED